MLLEKTVTPSEQAAVAQAVEEAFAAGTAIYPVGGATSLDYGVRPTRPGTGLTLAGLNRVVDYPARDLTITVEAGVTVAELHRQLAAERQRLPVDVPQAERATIGGVVATSPSGPRRFRWGTMRDYVIGVRAVDGRGQFFAGGGRVVKNAAGYDLCRLLTGSLGTLGVLTQVTLMVKPVPDVFRLVTCDLPDLQQAERLLAELIRSKIWPAAVELLAGPAWRSDATLGPIAEGNVARLVVGLEGTASEVDWMVDQLWQEWNALGSRQPRVLDGPERDQLWEHLVEFPVRQPSDNGASAAVLEIGVLPSDTVGILEQLLKLDPACSVQAHAGNGILRVRLSRPASELPTLLRKQLRPAVAEAHGSLVVLSAPSGCELDRAAVWGPPTGATAVMQAIKERFDPKGILNPGRFIFA